MANNFTSEIVSLENFSRGDHQEIIESKNLNYPTEICESEDEDSTVYEKHVVNHQTNLEERLKNLQTTMAVLRKQLSEERCMWKKQLEEAMQDSAAREHRPDNLGADDVSVSDITKETELTADIPFHMANLPKPEYEGLLNGYQKNVIKTLADKRANLRRQISINNYKRRLLEVENMCNLELLRVKQSVQFLQPLQMMASEWNSRNTFENNFANDEMPSIETQETSTKDYFHITNSEEMLSMEASANRFYSESNPLLTKSQYCSLQSPPLKSTSAIWQVGEDSTMWF